MARSRLRAADVIVRAIVICVCSAAPPPRLAQVGVNAAIPRVDEEPVQLRLVDRAVQWVSTVVRSAMAVVREGVQCVASAPGAVPPADHGINPASRIVRSVGDARSPAAHRVRAARLCVRAAANRVRLAEDYVSSASSCVPLALPSINLNRLALRRARSSLRAREGASHWGIASVDAAYYIVESQRNSVEPSVHKLREVQRFDSGVYPVFFGAASCFLKCGCSGGLHRQ